MANIRALTDVRFKLLALVPTISGIAVALLTREPDKALPAISILAVSVLGFVATFGVMAYDQRNSQLYDALIGRAKRLEPDLFGEGGGLYATRPDRERRFFGVLLWHDRALALIYAAALAVWTVPFVFAIVSLLARSDWLPSATAGGTALLVFGGFRARASSVRAAVVVTR